MWTVSGMLSTGWLGCARINNFLPLRPVLLRVGSDLGGNPKCQMFYGDNCWRLTAEEQNCARFQQKEGATCLSAFQDSRHVSKMKNSAEAHARCFCASFTVLQGHLHGCSCSVLQSLADPPHYKVAVR